MKKILILNGSPRIKGNTSCLIKEFEKGAMESGNEVKTFNLGRMNIHGCLGCFGGGKNFNHPCVQNDDMNQIYPYFKEADVIVLASPLYYWTISSQLKQALDRLFALEELDKTLVRNNKDVILLMASAGGDFVATEYWFKAFSRHMGWNIIGKVLVDGVHDIKDIDNKVDDLNKAYELGKSIN